MRDAAAFVSLSSHGRKRSSLTMVRDSGIVGWRGHLFGGGSN
jgi:hypothetical protein